MTDPTLRDELAKALKAAAKNSVPFNADNCLTVDAALSILSDALAQRDARIAELEENQRAMVSRLEGLHAQMFGFASMDAADLALAAIKDNGQLHEAVHDCLRAILPSAAKETHNG